MTALGEATSGESAPDVVNQDVQDQDVRKRDVPDPSDDASEPATAAGPSPRRRALLGTAALLTVLAAVLGALALRGPGSARLDVAADARVAPPTAAPGSTTPAGAVAPAAGADASAERSPGASAATPRATAYSLGPTLAPPPPARPAVPVRVRVASVGIDSTLVDLGLTASGALEVPQDFDAAGWYTGGPRPGEAGPAVIAGHVDSKAGPAVFYRLRELTPGTEIDVTLADGSDVRYTVERVEQYPKDAFPTQQVYGPDPRVALRLITCGGVFDRSIAHYRDNIVVYAVAAPTA